MKYSIPNIDLRSSGTIVPKEVLQKAYLAMIGETIDFCGVPTKINDVVITEESIVLDLEDSPAILKLLNSNHDERGFSISVDSKKTAHWLVWTGWSGNCDKRIENAKCSKCDYTHPTVYGSLAKLSNYCPGCGREMSINRKVNYENN